MRHTTNTCKEVGIRNYGDSLPIPQLVGTAVSDVYAVNFFTAAPMPSSTAVALVSALFQGKIPITAIPANLRVASFEQKPAGSGPDQFYITPVPGNTGPTTVGLTCWVLSDQRNLETGALLG